MILGGPDLGLIVRDGEKNRSDETLIMPKRKKRYEKLLFVGQVYVEVNGISYY